MYELANLNPETRISVLEKILYIQTIALSSPLEAERHTTDQSFF
jgi:hypothetical protein